MRTYIKVPIKILTPKLAENKQDSIFYAGKNIAEVKVRDRTYVLTTAGEYNFSLKEPKKGASGEFIPPRGYFSRGLSRAYGFHEPAGLYPEEETISINSSDNQDDKIRAVIKSLTDAKINKLGDLVSNWGWFGINVWEKRPDIPGLTPGQDQCLIEPVFVWSDYDEAMKAFIYFVEKDLIT